MRAGLVLDPLIAAQGSVHNMRAGHDMPVIHDEADPGRSGRPAAQDPDREALPAGRHRGYSDFQDMRTVKFTSAVPLAMITPVSPPIFRLSSTTVSSGDISLSR